MVYVPHGLALAPTWWLWLSCALAIALIPAAGWIARSPQRRRVVVALVVALVLSAGMASAAFPPEDMWEWCCPAWIPYWICYPLSWGC